MPMNLHAFARLIRSKTLEGMAETYSDKHIKFAIGSARTTSSLGIHLHLPAQYVVEDAVQRAAAEGFETIYIYLDA